MVTNSSIVPRPFPHPVFDRLQYAEMEGEESRVHDVSRHEGRREGSSAQSLYTNLALISLESTK